MIVPHKKFDLLDYCDILFAPEFKAYTTNVWLYEFVKNSETVVHKSSFFLTDFRDVKSLINSKKLSAKIGIKYNLRRLSMYKNQTTLKKITIPLVKIIMFWHFTEVMQIVHRQEVATATAEKSFTNAKLQINSGSN